MLANRLPLIASISLIGALAIAFYFQGAQLLEVYNENNSTSIVRNAPVAQVAKPKSAKTDHNIATFKLFGDATTQVVKPKKVPEKLPETRLNLKLTGVLAGKIEADTGAIIQGPNKAAQYYKIGDALPGNATLKHIYADRVVVERSGRLENLYFPEAFSNAGIQSVSPNQPSTVANKAPAPASKTSTTPVALPEARKQSIKDRLSKLRQRIRNSE